MTIVATLAQTATWAVSESNAATSLAFGNAPMEAAEEATFGPTESAATDHMYMIPLTCPDNDQYTVTFTIERDYEGLKNTYEHSVKIPASVTLAAGNSYCFTAEINAENITGGGEDNPPLCPIEFTVSEVRVGLILIQLLLSFPPLAKKRLRANNPLNGCYGMV